MIAKYNFWTKQILRVVKDGLTVSPDNNIACEGIVGTGKFAQEKLEKLIIVGASTYSKYGSLL